MNAPDQKPTTQAFPIEISQKHVLWKMLDVPPDYLIHYAMYLWCLFGKSSTRITNAPRGHNTRD